MRDAHRRVPRRPASVRRPILASLLVAGLAMVALPGLAAAADPSASPDPSTPVETPAATPTVRARRRNPRPHPRRNPRRLRPRRRPRPIRSPSTPRPRRPRQSRRRRPRRPRRARPTRHRSPAPTPTPTPEPTPAPPPPVAPRSMNLFTASGFRFQDPNWAACTATSVRTMLNLIAMRGSRGEGFIWRTTNSGVVRDRILAWERTHDTLTGGHGSDPHGWRNALNFYGWGAGTLASGVAGLRRRVVLVVRPGDEGRRPGDGGHPQAGRAARLARGACPDGHRLLRPDRQPVRQGRRPARTSTRSPSAGVYLTDPLARRRRSTRRDATRRCGRP